MALKRYRRQVINVHDANDNLPEVILSTGDEAGRIIQLAIIGGESSGTHCRFWLQKDADTNVFQDMESVTAPYPTWEAAINTGGLEPGTYPCMFRIGDDDGSVTETFRTTARVLQGMLIDAEESEEMQSQLNEFEQRTEDAISANQTATADATDAAERANAAAISAGSAATSATEAATAATEAATNVGAATTAANEAAEIATDAATAANNAAEDATDAATEARDAAAAALASAGNIVIGEMSMLDGSIETVDDAFVSPIRGIEVEGKSTQATVAGNQLALINADTITKPSWYPGGWDVTLNSSNGYTLTETNSSGGAGGFVAHLKAGEYTISFDTDDISHAWYLSVVRNDNGTAVVDIERSIGVPATTKVNETFTLTLEADYAIRPIITQKNGDSYNLNNIMLNSGSTALPFEPYVGGIPSPNPDYPQAIHSVAEAGQVVAGAQLFDVAATTSLDDWVTTISSNYPYIGIRISVPKNTDITISYANVPSPIPDITLNATQDRYYGKSAISESKWLWHQTAPGLRNNSATVRSNDSGYIWLNAYPKNQNAVDAFVANFGDQLMINAGDAALPWKPYIAPTTTPLIPEGAEPLRSLPNGVRDELIVHEDGSREIIRRVAVVDIENSTGTYVVYGDYKRWQINVPLLASISSSVSDRQNCRSNVFSIKTYENNAVPVTGANTDLINGSICIYRSGDTRLVFVGLPGETAGTWSDFTEWYAENDCMIIYPLETPVIEPLPSITMPSAPSSDVTAWLDSKDETSAPIATDASVSYERSMQIVIDKLEQAIADL